MTSLWAHYYYCEGQRMIVSWRASDKYGGEYWYSRGHDGEASTGSPEVMAWVEAFKGVEYHAQSGLICGPGPYTAGMVMELVNEQYVPFMMLQEVIENDEPTVTEIPPGAVS